MDPNRFYYHTLSDIVLVINRLIHNLWHCTVVRGNQRYNTGTHYYAAQHLMVPTNYEYSDE